MNRTNPLPDLSPVIGRLRRVLRQGEQLYLEAGRTMARKHAELLNRPPQSFISLMNDLHHGAVIKTYVTIVRADDRWTPPEKILAGEMIDYLWHQRLTGGDLRDAAVKLFGRADSLSWQSLLTPWVDHPPIAAGAPQVHRLTMRLAEIVAGSEGEVSEPAAEQLRQLSNTLTATLQISDAAVNQAAAKNRHWLATQPQGRSGGSAIEQLRQWTGLAWTSPSTAKSDPAAITAAPAPAPLDPAEAERRLQDAMRQLGDLIGLSEVKERVRSHSNFLKLQRRRADANLPQMPVSLHMTFVGNPGTGKTTVARIVGQILGSLGTLPIGHVVETDRSGLVAQYAGQTAVKTNATCDQARGGILFIDEAYALVSGPDDQYGREAIGTLLKRMEDDRGELAVILAGYSDEMEAMIRSNPGLSSRIGTTIQFADYEPIQLAAIFESLCDQNHFKLSWQARYRMIVGLTELHRRRDRHFGNGRLVRNAFEDSVRRLADRVADLADGDAASLTHLHSSDIRLPGIDDAQMNRLIATAGDLRIRCRHCGNTLRLAPERLAGPIKCVHCGKGQNVGWSMLDTSGLLAASTKSK